MAKSRYLAQKAHEWRIIMYVRMSVWPMAHREGNALNHFHETYIMTIGNSCKINHSTHPCGHSNMKNLWPCKHYGLGFVFHIQAKPVFQGLLFYQVIQNIQVHFGIWENILLFPPSGCTHFFSKTFVF